ncbi:glycosyltransferase family 4 protein [Fictibacillus phosphorivorans]|uniref:glycosyltransferase family 4 protein n=1 Tax=Fictibacillus phosphorivorans TaxID=1221500 RepID=UPI00203DFCAD|nr:glycosyltransferase family 4 protein [Fictibacillus phosphorivorans]MCM3717043.1 glycosyltransferase family 4 protein [Fictibacillus phosphorivorans]MCM3774730.1 glycosyltransferase family 4 protein [Fictibacillus phosphorivorans]
MKERALRVMFFTPYYHQNRGNSTTARRIQYGLQQVDVSVYIYAYEEEPFTQEIREKMEQADVFHILQFARFLRWAQKQQIALNKPYLITSGGTDVNHSLKEDEKRYTPLLHNAKAITVFTDKAKEALINDHGFLDKDVYIIPQSVYLPDHKGDRKVKLPKGLPKILLPAGLRSVKDVLNAVPVLEKLKAEYPQVVFLIIGANLDETVFEEVRGACKKYEWLHYLPEVDLSMMKVVYQWADIVINTSISEGQPTSLLEAMSVHRPVIARDNTGNTSIVKDKVNGLVYRDSNELYDSILKLLSDPIFVQKVIRNGYQTVKENHNIKKEIQSYVTLYEKIKERNE